MNAPRSKPLVTANQVTFARLVSMPFVVWAFYQSTTWMWIGLVVGVLIGLTDSLDGYLARKYGPTVLGGLMDPIADKVFVAVVFIPFADIHWMPAWIVALIFIRELLVTALRTAYSDRGVTLKTSYLAKTKTWVQMQGAATLFLVLLVDDPRVMWGLFGGGTALALVALISVAAIQRRLWRGAVIMLSSFAPLAIMYTQGTTVTVWGIALVVLAVTWISGLDYLISGLKQLKGRGGFRVDEIVRILGAALLPPLLLAMVHYTPAHVLPLAGILSVELAVGGLDNLLATHRCTLGAAAWGIRNLGASLLLGAALLAYDTGNLMLMHGLVYGAIGVVTIGAAREFWRGREYYMDARIREQKAVPHQGIEPA